MKGWTATPSYPMAGPPSTHVRRLIQVLAVHPLMPVPAVMLMVSWPSLFALILLAIIASRPHQTKTRTEITLGLAFTRLRNGSL